MPSVYSFMKRICNFISQWMAVLVILSATIALLLPDQVGTLPSSWITPLLGVIMFGMGMTLNIDDFKVVFSRPKDIVVGCLAQFSVMPLLAWFLARLFSLPAELAVGVVLVGSCPGGTASNVITYLAKGDLALSVGMTSVSTLLAPLLTPFITWLLAGTYVDVDTVGMLYSIVQVVILPILLGLLIKHYLPRFSRRITDYLPAFSSLAIALIVAIIMAANASKVLTSGLLVIVVVIVHNLLGFALGYLLGRSLHLGHSKCTAISIEVGMQNSGLACSLAQQHFATLAMAPVPGALFSVWHNISGALVAKLLRRLALREKMVRRTHE